MYDIIKTLTTDPDIIDRFLQLVIQKNFQYKKSNNKREDIYVCPNYGIKIIFNKSFENFKSIGYNQFYLLFKPHYIFNNGKHNGNDFNCLDAIIVLKEIFDYLEINSNDYKYFKVICLEFGVNVIIDFPIDNFISSLFSYNKTKYIVTSKYPNYYKETEHSKDNKYKYYKGYLKKNQLIDTNRECENVHANTFRHEVHANTRYLNSKKVNIYTIKDLFKAQTFENISNELINDLSKILIIENDPNKDFYNSSDYKFLNKHSSKKFWESIIRNEEYPGQYLKLRRRYNNISLLKKQFDNLIKNKLEELIKCKFSTHEFNKLFDDTKNHYIKCLESINANFPSRARYIVGKLANDNNEHRKCIVTNLDISMQQKRTKYLTEVGIKWYEQNKPKVYKEIINNYLPNDIDIIYNPIFYISKNLKELAKQKLNKL